MADIQTFGKFDLNFTTQIMELQIGYLTVTLQEVYDAAHDAMANLRNMDEPRIARASGQNDLGGGLATGLTVELLNGWRVKVADRGGPGFVRVSITGGNLITSEANGPDPNDPLAPANYVTYSIALAVSATIYNIAKIDQIHAVETGRWKIASNQMVFYDVDGSTPLYTFDLKDGAGSPTETNPKERVPV